MKTSRQNDFLTNTNASHAKDEVEGYGLTYQHNGDFLPRRQQLEPEALRYRDEAVLIISVQAVTFLKYYKLRFLKT